MGFYFLFVHPNCGAILFLQQAKFLFSIFSIFNYSFWFSHSCMNHWCKNFILAPKVRIKLWGILLWGKALYLYTKTLHLWPKWPTLTLHLAFLHLADTKNKKLTVTNSLFFIIGRHTFTILFYIWLIFSRHKTINT